MYDGGTENHSKQAKPSWEIFSVSPQNRIVGVVLFVIRAVPLPLHTPWHLCRPFLLELINASHIHVEFSFRREFGNSFKCKHFFLKMGYARMEANYAILLLTTWSTDCLPWVSTMEPLRNLWHPSNLLNLTQFSSAALFGGFVCLILVLIFCPDTIGRNILLLNGLTLHPNRCLAY